MMMKALEAGGLSASYRQSREIMRKRFADAVYDPNIGGLFELERQDYASFGFPKQYNGKLIKALNNGVPRMAVMPDGIKVVFMRRDSEEIRQSYNAFFNGDMKNTHMLNEKMEDIKEKIKNRKDVISFHEFYYRKVVENPVKYFNILANDGWPINSQIAASIVDPKYCRFKKELLEEGI